MKFALMKFVLGEDPLYKIFPAMKHLLPKDYFFKQNAWQQHLKMICFSLQKLIHFQKIMLLNSLFLLVNLSFYRNLKTWKEKPIKQSGRT